jgi:carbon-monoxide dehydrogenase large subunit
MVAEYDHSLSPTPRLIGERSLRVEDPSLLKGQGCFVDDVQVAGTLHAAFVRSPHAHAKILAVDFAQALQVSGVFAIYSAHELESVLVKLRMPLGFPTNALPQNITPFVLCPKEVCFVGEAVAVVVATSRHIAEDAAEKVLVEYEPLPMVHDCRQALEAVAPPVRLESPSNVLNQFKVAYGDIEAVFQQAHAVIKASMSTHRGGAHPIEGRGVLADFSAQGELTVWSSTQMSHDLRQMLAELLGLHEDLIRVIAPDVGGGFGCKFLIYPEEIVVAACSKLLHRPVKWIEDRSEHFISSIQEREQFWDMEMAVNKAGEVLGLRGQMLHDQGAYTPQGINCPYNAATGVTGPYKVGAYHLEVSVVQTNKVPTIPVRGAGYPEAAFVMERMLDLASVRLGLGRDVIRARNLVSKAQMPYEKKIKNRAGAPIILDSGDYLHCQEMVLGHIDFAGFQSRQLDAKRAGRYIGLGFAHGVKGTGRGPFESGTVKVSPAGKVSVYTGALAMGQGLKTALSQICAEQLGVSSSDVEVVCGDTRFVTMGLGGFASRQTVTAGSSVHLASIQVKNKALKVASQILEASEEDLELKDGFVRVKGTDQQLSLGDISRKLRGVPGYALPPGVEAGLEYTEHWQTEVLAYSHSFHACEVEVDVLTGGVKILRYVASQDSGKLINPMIVEGQLHGGITHGISNALFEFMGYDEQAQPFTTTFADYLLPTATEIPDFEILFHESPSPFNPLGVKGVGESGTVPVVSAVFSAIDDALKDWKIHLKHAPISPVSLLEQILAAGTPL